MTPRLGTLSACLFVLLRIFVSVTHGHFVEAPDNSLQSLAEKETILPCHYKKTAGETLVQVTWLKEKSDGDKDQIITVHHENGQSVSSSWNHRVRFRGSDPTVDSSLVIMTTEVSDAGTYICHISTFPSGSFDLKMSLIVWSIPISSLDLETVVEGQGYTQVASCRSVGRPAPRLSWDTQLNGQSANRSLDGGAVSSHFSLYPLRNMNGKKLDCLVWHPAFKGPQRISKHLVVHYPPHAEVSGYKKEKWIVGLEYAALRCVSGGNPKPHIFTWIRKGGSLPEGAIQHPNGTLVFGRALNLSDEGTYQCVAKNKVGEDKAEVEITVRANPEQLEDAENMMLIIVGGVAAGLLVLMLIIVIVVICHHKNKNKRLEQELTQKKDEISTLSRQASFRRVNSGSTDTRGATEENIPLRVEGTLRTSLSSLGEQAQCRDSRSTVSGGRGGGGGAFDSLGRPVLHNNSRRGRERFLERDEESRLRVETYVRNSNMSLQETRFRPPLMPSAFPIIQSMDIERTMNGSAIIPGDGGSRPGSVAKNHQHPHMSLPYPDVMDDEDEVDEGLGGPASQEHPDDQDSLTNSSQVSDAHSARYLHSNGPARSKIRMSPPLVSPHASLIHKAQIV
ncbi:nectin-4 isoform 2-T2 [Pholidichthys leucotaenia]